MQPNSAILPTLFTFGISHYCEKARWALDWHGVEYDEVSWPPVVHMILARRMGAKKTTVPILLVGDTPIQDSSEIIDWAEQNSVGRKPSLAAKGDLNEAIMIEQRVNNVIGVQARRHLYAETISHHDQIVKPAFFMNTASSHRLLGNLMWPFTRQIIKKMYDAGTESAPDSRAKLEAELDWLDAKLADGRRFLIGDRFSRVDLTAASILSLFSRPKQIDQYHTMSLPPTLAADVARWRARPSFGWINNLYDLYRSPH
jgi:glutathione S-transferase